MKKVNISFSEKYNALQKIEEGKTTKQVLLRDTALARIQYQYGLQTEQKSLKHMNPVR